MEMEEEDYYSDTNGMVHCGYHIHKNAKYINLSQICDVNDRLVCQDCYLFLKKHSQIFDSHSFVDIDDIFDENYQFKAFNGITKQLEQLNNLEKVQIQYMNDIEKFYENIKRDFVEQIDQCKKKILSLFTIQLEQQNIFKGQLEQLLRFDSFRYFVRTMSNHSLQCQDIEQFLQEQFRLSQTLDEITQSYIYSPEMIQFLAQIEQLKKVSKPNKLLKKFINDLQFQQSCNTFFNQNNNYQFTNKQLLEQIHKIDSKLLLSHSRKDSLEEQLQFIEKQKQSVMNIQQETFEDCDMFFFPLINENRNSQQERQNIFIENPGRSKTIFPQLIVIPRQVKYQLYSSSPLINSQTYEFSIELLNSPKNEFAIDIVQEKKKNQSDFKQIMNKKSNFQDENSIKDIFNSCSSLFSSEIINLNIRVNIMKKTMLIYNQNFKKNIELTNLNSHTNYRLSLTFMESGQAIQIKLTGVKLVF